MQSPRLKKREARPHANARNVKMRARPTQYNAADEFWRPTTVTSTTADQKRLVTLEGSLTAHLRMLGVVDIRVLRETVARPWSDERDGVQLAPRECAYIRDVVLAVNGEPFVAAHSMTPLKASMGVWKAMRALHSRPLAELLYDDSAVTRSPLVSRRITARHPLYGLAAAQIKERPPHTFVARRSVFTRLQSPLLVTECLLPAFWERLKQYRENELRTLHVTKIEGHG
jgi:chorismate--pyruvate lyase